MTDHISVGQMANGKMGATTNKYVAFISGFTSQDRCSNSDEFTHFYNQYRGQFNVDSVGAALGAGGGYLNFASPDETITGGGLYLSLGTGIDAGRADVFYRGLGGRKSYINPATGQVDISQLTSDILNGYGSEINLDHSFALGDATLRAFRVDAANAAETLALAYNASSTSRPCSC